VTGHTPAVAEPEALRGLAETVAREAGAQLCDAFSRVGELRIGTKSTLTDLVSEADLAAERLIRERLMAARPDDGLLGEEGSDVEGSSGSTAP
jgi:myo-inositol-1(or 4)-monophosphatase